MGGRNLHYTTKTLKSQQNPLFSKGFTIVELLIVVVVIAILASVTVVAYGKVTERANYSSAEVGVRTLEQAILVARQNTSMTLGKITKNNYTAFHCIELPSGTDIAKLPKTNQCWSLYFTALDRISEASGIDVRNVVDPFGRPYVIDENEGENPSNLCQRDTVAVYKMPHEYQRTYINTSRYPWRVLPPSGLYDC